MIMKKKITFFVLFIFLSAFQLFAQYPIPSYNITVNQSATFQEKGSSGSQFSSPDARRYLHIRAYCNTTNIVNCQATVWIYSLDGQTVYGPYTIYGGETLTIEIDDREWGVYVSSNDPISVDVWTDALGSGS